MAVTTTPEITPAPGAVPVSRGLGRPFAVQLTTTGLANLADGILQVALPLIALTLTRSPVHFGILTAAVWLPWLLLGIPAGVFIDRWDRRRTMIVALAVRALLIGVVIVVAALGQLSIWWLVGFAMAYGATEVFADLAAQAQVPALVGREASRLKRANSRILAVEQVMNSFLGAPIAGALVTLGVLWTVGVPAAVIVGAVLVIWFGLRGRFVAPRPEGYASGSLRHELSEGMRVLVRHPVLRPMMLAAGVFNFAGTGLSAVLVLWLVGDGSRGGLSVQTWSLVLLSFPVGAIIGSWLSGRIPARWSDMRVLTVAWAVNAVMPVVIWFAPTVTGAVIAFVASGIAGVVGNVVSGTMRPRMIPEHQLGRVAGASRVIGFGAMPLGGLIGGAVATVWGIPTVLAGVVVCGVVATLIVSLNVTQTMVDEHELKEAPGVDGTVGPHTAVE